MQDSLNLYRLPPSIEKTFEELNSNSVLNPVRPSADHTLEDAVKKAHENFAALNLIKDLCTLKSPTYFKLN